MLRYAALSAAMRRFARIKKRKNFWCFRSGYRFRRRVAGTLSRWMSARRAVREEAAGYRNGSRVEVRGTMYLKRRGDKLYFNLFADEICNAATDDADCVKGELVFRGKVGQNIEEKRDKKDQPYTVFSAFSAEKVDDGFEYQWVRFFCFGKEREAWLQPGVKVDAKGEMNLSAHNGKINLSCKMEELTQYVADSSNYNQ